MVKLSQTPDTMMRSGCTAAGITLDVVRLDSAEGVKICPAVALALTVAGHWHTPRYSNPSTTWGNIPQAATVVTNTPLLILNPRKQARYPKKHAHENVDVDVNGPEFPQCLRPLSQLSCSQLFPLNTPSSTHDMPRPASMAVTLKFQHPQLDPCCQ